MDWRVVGLEVCIRVRSVVVMVEVVVVMVVVMVVIIVMVMVVMVVVVVKHKTWAWYDATVATRPAGGGDGGVSAKDALGNEIFAQAYLQEKPANDRSLAQGLKGDATYLIVKEDKTLESYGLNAGE